MDNMKLPFSEASGKKCLHGTYRVSFLINIDSEDNVQASDVGLFLTEGLGNSLIEKVSSVDVEKIYKQSKEPLKPGDLIYLNQDVTVKATVVKDVKGIYCVGSVGEPICEKYDISLQRGTVAEVNKVAEGQAELIGFENDIEGSFIDPETDEPFNEYVRLDLVAVDLDTVEKVNLNPPKPTDEEVA
jgi:hypothetical protein